MWFDAHYGTTHLDGSLGEVEPLLDDGGELPDATSLLPEHVLGAGGQDDDLGTGRGYANLHARVAILSQLTSEELVELGLEHAIGHELKGGRKRV